MLQRLSTIAVLTMLAGALAGPPLCLYGCSSDGRSFEAVGAMELPLSTTAGGVTYTLSPARLRLTGVTDTEFEETASVGGAEVFRQNLLPGEYQVELLSGWILNENGAPVEAVLQSENPVSFAIEEGLTTRVGFSFGIGDLAIAFGSGLVEVGIDVNDEREVSSANTTVYFVSDDGRLAKVPIDGSEPPVAISPPPVAGGGVSGLSLTPDGNRIVYLADQDTVDAPELYAVDVNGTGNVKLNGPLVTGGQVARSFVVAAGRVVYQADQDTDQDFELYSSNLDGTGNVKLNETLVNGGFLYFEFVVTPFGRVVYRADLDSSEFRPDLYSVNLDGTGIVRVNGPFATQTGQVADFAVSPDGRIIYTAPQDTTVSELYASNLDGSGNVKLNGPLVTGGNVIGLGGGVFPDSVFTPDGRVLYLAVQDTAGVSELYASNLNGTGNVKLNGALVLDGNVSGDFQVSPDGNHVVYRADQDTDGVFELYASNLDGSGNVKLNGPLVTGGRVFGFAFSPDGDRIVYEAQQDSDGITELYASNLDGSGNVKLNGPLVTGGFVFDFELSADGNRVVYRADQDSDGITELYASNLDGSGNVKLNGPLVPGGGVFNFALSPDSNRVVYRADQETDEVFELYASDLDGSSNVKLGPLRQGHFSVLIAP